jgi:hypothetical protein
MEARSESQHRTKVNPISDRDKAVLGAGAARSSVFLPWESSSDPRHAVDPAVMTGRRPGRSRITS